MIKTVFFGTPEFAAVSLEYLIKQGIIPEAVVTVPDKPQGRSKKILPSPVKEIAEKYSIPCLQPSKLKSSDFLDQLKSFQAQLFVVVAFRILPDQVLVLPQLGAINLHASYLPDYRGASPIQTVLLNDEPYTGVTTFFLNKKIDGGDIIHRLKVPIKDEYNAGELYDILLDEGKKQLKRTIVDINDNDYTTLGQPETDIHYAPKFTKQDTKIRWGDSAREVFNRIRAFSPYPGAFTLYQDKTVKLFSSRVTHSDYLGKPGKIRIIKNRLEIETGRGVIEVLEIQAPGKKRMKTDVFLRGFSLKNDEFFS